MVGLKAEELGQGMDRIQMAIRLTGTHYSHFGVMWCSGPLVEHCPYGLGHRWRCRL